MRSTRGKLALLCVLLISAPASADRAHEVLERAKTAAGGAAIDGIRTTQSTVTLVTGGLKGYATSLEDNVSGRFVDRYELGSTSGANGFDGENAWSQDGAGQVRIDDGVEARLVAANEVYRRSFSYWTGRRPGQIEFAGEERQGEQHFDIVRITPEGGRPFELWIDSATHQIARQVEKASTRTSTIYFSDYREVAGVSVAHSLRVSTGDPRYETVIALEALEFNAQIEPAKFAMPAPPVRDFGFANHATSTTVPFDLINNHIYVQVKLNGRGPYRLLCDTGGANIVTPAVAKELGLRTEGKLEGRGVGEESEDISLTQLGRIEIGAAFIDNPKFYVFPLGTFSNVEGVPALGLVGYEVFKRFVVRIDYQSSQLTLSDPEQVVYNGPGTAVPFQFNEHVPQVEGAIDGIKGVFDIDTGSRSSVDLFAPFVEKHKLKGKYRPRFEGVTGWGVGGPSRSAIARANVLRLGSVEIKRPVTELTLQTKGSFTNEYSAGNVGAGVLKRFNLVFDYGRKVIYFERNANDSQPDVFDRSGMWINVTEGGGSFDVVDVMAGGPADRAGLEAGDQIVKVDGARADDVPLPDLRKRFRSDPPGTKITVEFARAGKVTAAEVILRDLT
jgi:PDZ domain-containing protein/aspartyl protease